MSAPEQEPQVTDFEAVTKELTDEGVMPSPPEPKGEVQDPPSEGAPAPAPPPEPPAPAPEPPAEPPPADAGDPPSPEGGPVISEGAQKIIDDLEGRVSAADRAANLASRRAEDILVNAAGIKDRDEKAAFVARAKRAQTDPSLADELIGEIVTNAATDESKKIDPQAELVIRNHERNVSGGMFMDQMREEFGLTDLTDEQRTKAFEVAREASGGSEKPLYYKVLAAELEISAGSPSARAERAEKELKELRGEKGAEAADGAGDRLRGGGPESPSEPVAGKHFTRSQIEAMSDIEYDRNEGAILEAESQRVKRIRERA